MDFLVYFIAIAILIIVLKILMFPIKLIGKFIINSVIGGVILYLLAKVGIFITVTWWSIVLTGILGIPGVIISVILSMFIF